MKHVLPRLRRPQTPISAVGSDKSTSEKESLIPMKAFLL